MSIPGSETSLPTSQETERKWQKLHRQFAVDLLARVSLRETDDGGPKTTLEERLIQAIWNDQMLRTDELYTSSGKKVEVLETGRWNTSRGPDFLDARIRLAGEEHAGDIEIHIDSADWRRHGHHQNFEYNRVVLHVVLRAHDDRPYEEKNNGERLERLVIEEVLEPDLETIQSTVNLSDYPYGRPLEVGLCHDQFLRLPKEQLYDFLTTAGRSRMESKIARFEQQLSTASFHQVLYQALMTAQGFKSSKTLYFLLSKRAPLAELVDHARDVREGDRPDLFLSVFLHVAQLFHRQRDLLDDLDGESQEFYRRLEELWAPVRPYFADRLIPPTRRWFAGMRPVGFPTRRLAGVAVLLGRITRHHGSLFDQLADDLGKTDLSALKPRGRSKFWKSLAERIFVGGDEHYFGTHFTLGGKKQKPQALIGSPAAYSLILNVFLPMAILRARQENDRALERKAWEAVYTFPSLEKNSIVKFMERRLFGDTGEAKSLLKQELFQQAFLKIFQDCCSSNERTCDHCTFYALASEPGSGSPV